MVLMLVTGSRKPCTTSVLVSRNLIGVLAATLTQSGTKPYWSATSRAVSDPSCSCAVPRLLSANSPPRWRVVGSILSTLLGGVNCAGHAGHHDDRHHHGQHSDHDSQPAFFGTSYFLGRNDPVRQRTLQGISMRVSQRDLAAGRGENRRQANRPRRSLLRCSRPEERRAGHA
jgi:hypothetical protein